MEARCCKTLFVLKIYYLRGRTATLLFVYISLRFIVFQKSEYFYHSLVLNIILCFCFNVRNFQILLMILFCFCFVAKIFGYRVFRMERKVYASPNSQNLFLKNIGKLLPHYYVENRFRFVTLASDFSFGNLSFPRENTNTTKTFSTPTYAWWLKIENLLKLLLLSSAKTLFFHLRTSLCKYIVVFK